MADQEQQPVSRSPVEAPIPNDTRYVFIEAIVIPRTQEQAELLAGLAQTHMEMKLVPIE